MLRIFLVTILLHLLLVQEGISFRFVHTKLPIGHYNTEIVHRNVVLSLSWSPHSLVSSLFPTLPASPKEENSPTDATKEKVKEQNESEQLSNNESEDRSSFGQSFIGRDVCGSKYNDDPFDAADGKEEPIVAEGIRMGGHMIPAVD